MIESVPNNQLNQVSFPDCEVSLFEASSSQLVILIDGIFIDNRGMFDSSVKIVISNWTSAMCERFDSNGANPTTIDTSNSGVLGDICEWRINDDKLEFAGFEKHSGLWQRYTILNADINIQFED